jgi:hypothetical protein
MANAIHAVVRTDDMTGTDVRSQLVSVKYMGADKNTPTDIDNGHVVLLDKLMEGEREVYVGTDVAANSKLSDVVLIASPEVMYDERLKNLSDFYNEAGTIARGYHIPLGDTFSVTGEALDGTKKVGDVVELAAGTKLTSAASGSGATVVGRIVKIEKVGRYTYYAIKVD